MFSFVFHSYSFFLRSFELSTVGRPSKGRRGDGFAAATDCTITPCTQRIRVYTHLGMGRRRGSESKNGPAVTAAALARAKAPVSRTPDNRHTRYPHSRARDHLYHPGPSPRVIVTRKPSANTDKHTTHGSLYCCDLFLFLSRILSTSINFFSLVAKPYTSRFNKKKKFLTERFVARSSFAAFVDISQSFWEKIFVSSAFVRSPPRPIMNASGDP